MLAVSRSILCLLAISSGATAAAEHARPVGATGVKTVIVVRHAEVEAGPHGGDPALSAAGKARAAELARVLVDAPLTSVYATHFQRNRMTAAALPRRAGQASVEPKVIDDVQGTLRALRAEPWGATTVVVGHSNTIGELLRGLTGRPIPDEPILFDRMWVVTVARDGSSSLLRLHYGAPVPVPDAP